MGRIVRVTRIYEKLEEDFAPDDYLDLDSSKFWHIVPDDAWPPQRLEDMVKIDEISLENLEDLGYDVLSDKWEIIG